MSLKSIDMSFAVHKNSDAGILQRELQHKPEADQAALAQASVKSAETNRQRTAKLDETDKSQVRDRKNGGHKSGGAKGKTDKRAQAGGAAAEGRRSGGDPEHPYKGQHIDLSL